MKPVFLYLLAGLMLVAGMLHFLKPKVYLRMMPPWVPAHRPLVYLSGAFEILGGAGLLVPSVRPLAAWGLAALLVAVFPANVHMAVHHIGIGRKPPPRWVLWARLPLQPVLIAWACWLAV